MSSLCIPTHTDTHLSENKLNWTVRANLNDKNPKNQIETEPKLQEKIFQEILDFKNVQQGNHNLLYPEAPFFNFKCGNL